MYYDIFISHHEKTELDLAKRIKEKLWTKRKIKVFVAKNDIPPDTPDWDMYITGIIKNSRSVLVLYNKEAANSSTVKGEMLKAKDFKRDVIIFKENEVKRSEIPIYFRAAQHQKFNIKNPEELINQVLEMRWKKNPDTISSIHDLYEKARECNILTPSLTNDDFLKKIREKLEYVFEYELYERLPLTEKYYNELKNLIKKMLDGNKIEKTGEYKELERREGTKKALHILSVGIWKEGVHKGIL